MATPVPLPSQTSSERSDSMYICAGCSGLEWVIQSVEYDYPKGLITFKYAPCGNCAPNRIRDGLMEIFLPCNIEIRLNTTDVIDPLTGIDISRNLILSDSANNIFEYQWTDSPATDNREWRVRLGRELITNAPVVGVNNQIEGVDGIDRFYVLQIEFLDKGYVDPFSDDIVGKPMKGYLAKYGEEFGYKPNTDYTEDKVWIAIAGNDPSFVERLYIPWVDVLRLSIEQISGKEDWFSQKYFSYTTNTDYYRNWTEEARMLGKGFNDPSQPDGVKQRETARETRETAYRGASKNLQDFSNSVNWNQVAEPAPLRKDELELEDFLRMPPEEDDSDEDDYRTEVDTGYEDDYRNGLDDIDPYEYEDM